MKCKNCGSPLDTEDKAGQSIKCSFCGTKVKVPKKSKPSGPANTSEIFKTIRNVRYTLHVPKKGTWRIGAILFLVIFASVGILVYFNVKPVLKARKAGLERLKELKKTKKLRAKIWRLNELSEAFKGGWFNIDPKGISGSIDNFDPITNHEWAMTAARAWSNDVRLSRIGIDNVREDGLALDLTKEGDSVEWRFYSPSRAEAAKKMREVTDEDIPPTGFRLWFRNGKFSAMITNVSVVEGIEPPKLSCSLANIIKSAKMSGKITIKRPFFRLDMYSGTIQKKRWYWDVQPERGKGEARIDPETCKVVN